MGWIKLTAQAIAMVALMFCVVVLATSGQLLLANTILLCAIIVSL
jgi:hypothetical protein